MYFGSCSPVLYLVLSVAPSDTVSHVDSLYTALVTVVQSLTMFCLVAIENEHHRVLHRGASANGDP